MSDRFPAKFGSSLLGANDIYARLAPFIATWKARGGPKLYFVSLDFQKSFDSIEHEKLLDVMDKILSEDEYGNIFNWDVLIFIFFYF